AYCLARAVALDPQNERRRLSLLRAQERRSGRAKPAPRGQCPFCDLPWAQEPERCARCRGRIDFRSPHAFLEPQGADVRLLRRCVARLSEKPAGAAGLRVLALAHLNLGDLSEALPVLRELARTDPRDEAVRLQLLAVSGQLQCIHVESGFETEPVERPTREELGIA
ncbi:MAG: tetratricopeptide repeat protein, partial [Acidobacteriota bacterium]